MLKYAKKFADISILHLIDKLAHSCLNVDWIFIESLTHLLPSALVWDNMRIDY